MFYIYEFFCVGVMYRQVNMMLVMLLWVYIHTGQAWKICLAAVLYLIPQQAVMIPW